mmetsp:Transcript_64008/g.152894  ORF Transcript_64008/g.152894 Transcript_64008/m.152894 type:complete len:204 (-) Transcript_64008:95-706(-)
MELLGNDHGNEPSTISEKLLLKRELLDQILLAHVIHLQSNFRKLVHDGLCALVFCDATLVVEQYHVGLVDGALQAHHGVNALFLLCILELAAIHADNKVNTALCMVFSDIIDVQLGLLISARHVALQKLLVVLCPLSQRQLCYLQDGAARLRVCAAAVVFALFSGWSDCAGKPSVPWRHASHWLLLDELPHVCNDVEGVVVWY